MQPTPRMGGLAMYVGVVAAVLLASQLPALTRGFVYSSGMPAVVVAGGLIMAIGLIDDRWGLDALTKFAGQITAASVLVTMGVAWSVLYIPIGGVGTIVLDQVDVDPADAGADGVDRQRDELRRRPRRAGRRDSASSPRRPSASSRSACCATTAATCCSIRPR